MCNTVHWGQHKPGANRWQCTNCMLTPVQFPIGVCCRCYEEDREYFLLRDAARMERNGNLTGAAHARQMAAEAAAERARGERSRASQK